MYNAAECVMVIYTAVYVCVYLILCFYGMCLSVKTGLLLYLYIYMYMYMTCSLTKDSLGLLFTWM